MRRRRFAPFAPSSDAASCSASTRPYWTACVGLFLSNQFAHSTRSTWPPWSCWMNRPNSSLSSRATSECDRTHRRLDTRSSNREDQLAHSCRHDVQRGRQKRLRAPATKVRKDRSSIVCRPTGTTFESSRTCIGSRTRRHCSAPLDALIAHLLGRRHLDYWNESPTLVTRLRNRASVRISSHRGSLLSHTSQCERSLKAASRYLSARWRSPRPA